MPGRKYTATNTYRYGFNGKENDNEVKGEGNQQDYGMRIYDPRLGKFLSVDPLTTKYPFYTPYQFAGNSPILAIDIDGLEGDKNVNLNEKDAIGEQLALPAKAKIIERLMGGEKMTNSDKKTNSILGGVGSFSIAENIFRAKYNGENGNFLYYKNDANGEIYNPDNYIFGGYTREESLDGSKSSTKAEAFVLKASGNINFTYFNFKSNYTLATANAYNYTGTGKLPLAIDMGAEASVTTGDASLRLGSINNNLYGIASGKLFSANANITGGIYSGENNKYGLGYDLNAGAYVAQGKLQGGATLLGTKAYFEVEGTAASAHIGSTGGIHYNSSDGNLKFTARLHAGLGLGAGLKVNFEIPVRTYTEVLKSTVDYLFGD